MGRIKSTMIKRASKELLARSSDKFNDTFTQNKKILSNNLPSKSIRNRVAGYIAHILKMKKMLHVRQIRIAAKLAREQAEQAAELKRYSSNR